MLSKLLKFLPFLIVVIPIVGSAQLTNEGSLYIDSDTDISTLETLDNTLDGNLINDGNLFIYDNYINEGLATFSIEKTTGTTWIASDLNSQAILASFPIDCYNIVFNNSSNNPLPIRLSGGLSIYGNADFTQGIVDTDTGNGILTFENETTVTSVSDDSYVEGAVFKVGNESFDFPIGNQSFYRKASISAPANSSDSFSLRYYYDTPQNLTALPSNITLIDDREYWIIRKESASSDIILTLSWDDSTTTPTNLLSDPADLRIIRWDENSNSWIDEGGIVDITNQTVSSPVNITNYGIFTLAKGNSQSPANPDMITIINNGITANGDGINDYFKIHGLENTRNTVSIFNRWGSKVYETSNYDTNGNVFNGTTEYKGMAGGNGTLPSGTYFYVISFTNISTGVAGKKLGYLYIN